MKGSNQKITGYLKIISPTDSTLITGGESINLVRLSRRRDEIVLDLTLRDKKNHYFYDDANTKFSLPEPCPPCLDGRTIEQGCGQDLCDGAGGILGGGGTPPVTNIRNPGGRGSGGGGGGGFIVPTLIPPIIPPRPRPPEEEEEEEEEEQVGCPSNVTRYGRVGDSCSEECCLCGDVQHCIEITSYNSGFIVRQCAPIEALEDIQQTTGCAGFGFCSCPDCGCDGSDQPGGPCYCRRFLPRRSPSVEFKTCDTKTVRACWNTNDGLEENGRMKFSASDGTTAFLDFETGSFIPGDLGSGLQHNQNAESEDPLYPGVFDSCPQDSASSSTCLLACGYGDTQPGYNCEPREILPPEVNRNGCQNGSTTYYQYACYGILTCPAGTHFSECVKVPRITFSWKKIELQYDDGGRRSDIPTPTPIGLPYGGPEYSPATDCQTRTASSCGQESDGSLPEDYQTNWGGTLYPPAG